MALEIKLDQDRMRRLIEVGPWLISQLDLDTVLDRLLDTAREVTGARYAALGGLGGERDGLERFITRGLSPAEEHAIGDRPRGRGILGLLTAEPRALRLGDLTQHPASYGFPEGHPPMRSFLGVPIVIGGAPWGNIYLTDKRDGPFDAEDEQAVTILAAWAATAIEHTRALQSASAREAELQQTLNRLEAMQAIAVAVGAETELGTVLQLIAERGRQIIAARALVIMLQDGDDLVAAAGDGQVSLVEGMRLPIAESSAGEVVLTQRAIRVMDAETDLRLAPELIGVHNAGCALLVPLIYRARALGVLAAFDRDDGFSESDEHLMSSFAASAATAVATAQSVQSERLRHTIEAAEAERKFWARELHDETLQALGGLKLIASSARRNPDAAPISGQLDQLIEGIDLEIENLHSIISSLRPAALDDLGLRPALEALAEHHRVSDGFEVSTHLRLPDASAHERRLAPELEVTIYRLVQEALTNAAKHSKANRVDITVNAHDRRVSVRVADDGGGFDPARTPSAGFGLTGMRERVALAGGELELVSSPGGTTVAAALPISYAP